MNKIPATLAPFFHKFNLSVLDAERNSFTFIERTLKFGDRAALRWFFQTYFQEQIREWGDKVILSPSRMKSNKVG